MNQWVTGMEYFREYLGYFTRRVSSINAECKITVTQILSKGESERCSEQDDEFTRFEQYDMRGNEEERGWCHNS